MGEVKRSDSKGDINNLLDDIRGIVNDNKNTLDVLKTIKQKNEEIAKTKRSVDIPSIVAGHRRKEPNNSEEQYLYFPLRKWSEIDIPHRKAKAGEHEAEINKRNKRYTPLEEPEPSNEGEDEENMVPVIEVDTVGPVESAPPPPARIPRREESEERRKRRRDRTECRHGQNVDNLIPTFDIQPVSTYDPEPSNEGEDEEDMVPVIEVDTVGPVESAPPPPARIPRRDESEERRKRRRDKSVDRKRKIEALRQKTYDRRTDPEPAPNEPPRRGREPRRSEAVKPGETKPEEKKPGPPSRRRPVSSPVRNGKPASPPRTRSRSRPNRRDQNGVPTVEAGSGPTEHAVAPEPPTRTASSLPPEPKSNGTVRGRTPSGHSDAGHGHLYRIRKDSEGSVEIFPDFIEEHNVVTEFKSPSISRHSSFDDLDEARPGVSPGRSLPRNLTSKWFAKANISTTSTTTSHNHHSLKRRIILEKCPHCQDGDSPPEIEIRICKRSGKCGKFRSQDDIHIVPGESLNLQATPDPPARASSLNRIPQDQPPISPNYYRTKSPSEMEMERLSRRLCELKQEVNSVIKDCETDNIPLNVSVRDSKDRPRSPYYPDKSPYYRARYHSAPQSPTGQNNKTTSTTGLLNPKVYHPAREERSSQPVPLKEVLHLSTQSLELPADDGKSITEQLEMEVESLSELESHFVPVQHQAPAFYEVYEPECDLELASSSTTHDAENMIQRPKREEQLLTPPPLPARAGDIALRKDILYDPFHIGTTYVVLSKQNHGRFQFHAPPDPNNGSPTPTTPVKGSPKSKPATPVYKGSPRQLTKEPIMPVIASGVAAPVSSTPPVLSPPISSSRRALYQPKSMNGSLMSLTSMSRNDLDATPSNSKLQEFPTTPSKPAVSQNGSGAPPPLPARAPGKQMTPDQRRGFIRPTKEPFFRELAVDAPDQIQPVLPDRRTSDQQKNLASRDYHLQTIMDVESPGRLDTWSGAPPPAERGTTSHPRPFSPSSQNSLRRSMPHVKLLGDEWKELAQGLGYENSQIASFARDFPDPGQALLDHWSKQAESRLDDLLKQLKFMGLWKTADTLDKTFDTTNV